MDRLRFLFVFAVVSIKKGETTKNMFIFTSSLFFSHLDFFSL